MKSLYQFRLLDELKASDTQVRISQLIGRKNEDGSLRDVEFQKETVVLQNGDGSVFEMAFASASGGMLTFHKRGLDENNPPAEKEYNKKTWGNGTKCYITAGAGDFIDKDEPGVWNGKQIFEGGIIVKGDTAFDGQIDAKRGVKNPTFASKEEATSFFSESEKVEGLLVNIKGNTYRWNSITKSWEMLGLADINQEKVQENSTKISTLEEKLSTAEGQISQLVEAGTPSYLGITAIVGEKYTMEDTLFLQKTPTLADSTIAINVGDVAANKEQHIQRISNGESSNQLKLKMDKFGAPTTSVIVEVRKGVKVDVSEKEAYRYGGDELLASATLPYTTFTTEAQEITVNFDQPFQLAKGELYSVVVKQENGIVNGQNFYRLYCDSTQYSEAFSAVAVNGNSRVRSRLMPYCVSDCFLSDAFVKAGIINKINITNTIPFVSDGWNLVYSNNGDFIYSKKIHQGIPADIKNTIDVGCFFHADLTITPSNNYRFIFGGMLSNNAINYPGGLNALKTMRSSIGNPSTKVDFSLSAEGLDISKDIYAYFGYATTARYGESLLPFIQNAKLTINGTVSAYKADIKTRIGFASSIEEIGNPVKNIIFGVHEGRFIGEQIDPTITSTATTGYIPPVNAIGYMSIIGADGKRYKIRVYGE